MALLADKVAIVTGAGRGIGAAEAHELARQGAAVLVNDVDAEAARAVVEKIVQAGGRAAPHTGDVSEVDVAESLVSQALGEFGRLDALVNNAGVLRDRTLANMSDEEWDLVVRVHLRGHFAPTRAALRHWRAAGVPGRIVCTSSTSGLLGNFGQSNYGAAKAGIAAFAVIVAQEAAKHGITCNAIAPAARTRMTESAYGRIESAGGFDFWSPENVAPLVAYLCSDAAAHISGKVFGVQGDAIELYQPWTSVAVVENGGQRFEPTGIEARINELFEASGLPPGPTPMMEKLRYRISRTGA